MKKIIPFVSLLFVSYFSHSQNTFYFNVLSPFQVSGTWNNTEFGNIGEVIPWGWDGEITDVIAGELVYVDANLDDERFFCEANDADYSGKLVFIDRGECEFSQKALFAQDRGALAVILKNTDDQITDMAGGNLGDQVFIPIILLPTSIANPIANELLFGQTVTASLSPQPMSGTILSGKLAIDNNSDCVLQEGEQVLNKFRVQVESMGLIKTVFTNESGEYVIGLPAGSYAVSVDPNPAIWEPCPAENVVLEENTSTELDLLISSIDDCPYLTADISTARLRRCFDNNTYYVNYCNQGSTPADNSYVVVTLDDLLVPISSNTDYIVLSDNVLRFNLGTLDVNECGVILINIEVLCEETMLGQTLCSTAEIFPFFRCGINNLWSDVDVRANANCDLNQGVQLMLSNQGDADMPAALNYRVIQNDLVIENGTFQLNAGDQKIYTFPANGSTYRIISDPIFYDIVNSYPSAAIESCSDNVENNTSGFINLFSPGDYGDYYDQDCTEIIGSFDPNDKAAHIEGYGPKHYIDQNVNLKYKVRFQNTGTDTAFTVVIRDTLSAALDVSTLRPVASSHTYNITVSDNIIIMDFPNILLPDSTTNEPASNGFIEFFIDQLEDVELETEITNRAAIYFDFNEPVITNTVLHTVGKDFLDVLSDVENVLDDAKLNLFPNPTSENFLIQISDGDFIPSDLIIYDHIGKLVLRERINNNSQLIDMQSMNSGIYFYELYHRGQQVAKGKLVKIND